jgi:hypothetical protein
MAPTTNTPTITPFNAGFAIKAAKAGRQVTAPAAIAAAMKSAIRRRNLPGRVRLELMFWMPPNK